MIDPFFLRVALAAVGVAFAAGPFGCFVIWRRMVYFGDTLSHAALLGVAFALALELPLFLGVLLCALAITAIIFLADGRLLNMDALLGIAAHSALALGLVAVSLLQGVRVDMMGYLIGDILAVSWQDVIAIWVGVALALLLLTWRWRRLLVATLDREMARAHGVDPWRESVIFMVALAILVAVSIKVVGALLITALLIIPPAAARLWAASPEAMVRLTALIGALSGLLGLLGSFAYDTPTGPSIVVAALALLILSSLVRRLTPSGRIGRR